MYAGGCFLLGITCFIDPLPSIAYLCLSQSSSVSVGVVIANVFRGLCTAKLMFVLLEQRNPCLCLTKYFLQHIVLVRLLFKLVTQAGEFFLFTLILILVLQTSCVWP